jgi:hypothetical protein
MIIFFIIITIMSSPAWTNISDDRSEPTAQLHKAAWRPWRWSSPSTQASCNRPQSSLQLRSSDKHAGRSSSITIIMIITIISSWSSQSYYHDHHNHIIMITSISSWSSQSYHHDHHNHIIMIITIILSWSLLPRDKYHAIQLCMHASIHQFINAYIYLSHPSHPPNHVNINLMSGYRIYPSPHLPS